MIVFVQGMVVCVLHLPILPNPDGICYFENFKKETEI